MPEFKFFPETHVALVSEIGPYKKSIPRGFRRLFDWLEAEGIQPSGPALVIMYDDPVHVVTENQRCDLCVPVGPDVTGSGDVRTREIGGWRVAAIAYEGERNARRAFRQVYDWLREQAYRPADVPIVKYQSQLGEPVRAEIGVPVIKLKVTRLIKGERVGEGKSATAARKATSPKKARVAKKTRVAKQTPVARKATVTKKTARKRTGRSKPD